MKEPKTPTDANGKAAPRPTFSTRVGTGASQFLLDHQGQAIDGRTLLARRYREVTGRMHSDLGGEGQLSEAQRQLVKRAAGLTVQAELLEAYLAAMDRENFNLADYVSVIKTQCRVFAMLGLERQTRNATPVLADYIEGRRIDAEPGDRSVS